MEDKQVNVHPQGIYYFCPHCKSHMKIEYHSNFCPDCGEKLFWDDVNEYNNITSNYCYYEDNDETCKYYRKSCNGSKNCNYILHNIVLSKNVGKLTRSERRELLIEKGWE
jgi:hypothetical protein